MIRELLQADIDDIDAIFTYIGRRNLLSQYKDAWTRIRLRLYRYSDLLEYIKNNNKEGIESSVHVEEVELERVLLDLEEVKSETASQRSIRRLREGVDVNVEYNSTKEQMQGENNKGEANPDMADKLYGAEDGIQ